MDASPPSSRQLRHLKYLRDQQSIAQQREIIESRLAFHARLADGWNRSAQAARAFLARSPEAPDEPKSA
ncbi:MAG: hypothetical protein ACLFR7_09440 [Opitutales bacterium]